MIMSGHPFIKALAAYWGGAFVQGLRCHFISMPGKSPMKLEVTSRHDHSCLLGRKASKQTNKQKAHKESCIARNLSSEFLTMYRSDTNGAVQPYKMAKRLKMSDLGIERSL